MRMARTFAYGFLSIILVVYLAAIGFDGWHIGLLLTLTLVGDAAIRPVLTRPTLMSVGRRLVLRVGAALMAGAGSRSASRAISGFSSLQPRSA